MPLQEIHTQRTRLIALTQGELEALLNDPKNLAMEFGCHISSKIMTDVVERAIRMKIQNMNIAPISSHSWYTYWLLVITHDCFGAGLIGFKGITAGYEQVEIGYGIDPDYSNEGFTTEGSRALIQWAFQDERCNSIVACQVRNDNFASIRVLQKLGFTVYEIDQETSNYIIHKQESQAILY